MKEFLKRNRQRINQDLPDIDQRKFFSPALYILTKKILIVLRKYAKGRLIDIGCGDMPFKRHLTDSVTRYESLDRESRTEGVTYIGDAMDMHMVSDESYDTAICFEVLEHVPNPFKAVSEIKRILKIEGILLLSVPHMWIIHEAPHDYLRFTNFGLKYILEENQFEVISIEAVGGLFSFLGHFVSSGILCLFWRVPLLKQLMFFLMKWLVVLPCAMIDDKVVRSQIAPLEYLCVAKKR